MKAGFYPKLAAEGIRKNRRMYLPYILTCMGMVMMTYILNYLKTAQTIKDLPGGNTIQSIMGLGVAVLAFFSALFLFYTNSFLIRRRKKEFGLYNILGMGKKNIGRIIFWESVFVAFFSVIMGLLGGIAVSKLSEVGFINMMSGNVTYTLSVSVESVIFTVIPFACIFLLLFLNSLLQVWFSSAISLLRSENSGEKPPKANWFGGILGIVILLAAYYLAVTIKDPISALGVFFVAVIMVIGATYLIMIAGSVLLCRVLQQNKNFYYKPKHFVSVSSMVYRMKRNGAGLAAICILVTMVLVIISSTVALFIGSEDVLYKRYPRQINTSARIYENEDISDEMITSFKETIAGVLDSYGTKPENILSCRMTSISGMLNGGDVIYDTAKVNDFYIGTYSDVVSVYLIPLADYNEMTGREVVLEPDEAVICSPRIQLDNATFGFQNGVRYRVKEYTKESLNISEIAIDIVPSVAVIVPDAAKAAEGLKDAEGNDMTYRKWVYNFDTALDAQRNIRLNEDLKEALKETFSNIQLNENVLFSFRTESREANRDHFLGLYGGIFYLGILLSIVFLFAAVLIIYYKQISEGYEDQARFEIMQKVGMTKKDIRRSINSQLLMVFFFPLLLAGLHLAFAFPIIEKLLLLFNLNNRNLFIATSIGSFLIFALFYVIVYRITSNAYYDIVSEAKTRE